MKRVVIYCQDHYQGLDQMIEKMKDEIKAKGWQLLGGTVDLEGHSDQLHEITEKLVTVDAIITYNVIDSFNYELLKQLQRIENVEIIEYDENTFHKI